MAKPVMVGSRELKNRLGGYLKQVKQGRTIIVTARGEAIAELRPLPKVENDEDPAWARLIASGAVTRQENRPLTPFKPIRSRGGNLSDAIIEDREDRF